MGNGYTSMAWDRKKIYAKELAVIVPITEAVLDDRDYNIWGEVQPRLVESFGKKIDFLLGPVYLLQYPPRYPRR